MRCGVVWCGGMAATDRQTATNVIARTLANASPPTPATMFPTFTTLAKRLQLGCYVNVRVLRDHAKREAFAAAEQTRQALR